MGKRSLVRTTSGKSRKPGGDDKTGKAEQGRPTDDARPETSKGEGTDVAPQDGLVFRKFEPTGKEGPVAPRPESEGGAEGRESPGIVDGYSGPEAERIRRLLLKKFDETVEPAGEPSAFGETTGGGPHLSEARERMPATGGGDRSWGEPGASGARKQRGPGLWERVTPMMDKFWQGLEQLIFQGVRIIRKGLRSTKGLHRSQRPLLRRADVRMGLVGLLVAVLFILAACYVNAAKFYFNPEDGAVEVLRGRFSPVGVKFVERVEGLELPDSARRTYGFKEAYSLLLDHYMKQSEEVVDSSPSADYSRALEYLEKALPYALAMADRKTLWSRIDQARFMQLLGKAQQAMGSRALAEVSQAADYLSQAAPLAKTVEEKQALARQLERVKKSMGPLRGE